LFRFVFSKLFFISICTVILFTIPFTNFSSPAYAHEYSASFTTLELTKTETIMTFSLDELSVIELAGGDADQNGRLDASELEAIQADIQSVLSQKAILKIDNEPQLASFIELSQKVKGLVPQVEFVIRYPALAPAQSITFLDNLYENDSKTNYVDLLTVEYGGQTSTAALSAGSRSWSMIVTEDEFANFKEKTDGVGTDEGAGAETSDNGTAVNDDTAKAETHANTSGWFSFLKLGMHHILFGFDHLLFLLTLLIVRQSFKQLAWVITAFTIAHSITITLTVLGWIQLPSLFVEAVIALSICYVALENIFRKEIRYRSILTFVFGLIHGMGFAGILLEMNLPKASLAVNLASFNIGIEVIQLAIVALLLPLLTLLHRWKHARSAVVGISGLAFVLGAIWLVQRLFF
jgi:hydrogenase/urease accessory protein HupE